MKAQNPNSRPQRTPCAFFCLEEISGFLKKIIFLLSFLNYFPFPNNRRKTELIYVAMIQNSKQEASEWGVWNCLQRELKTLNFSF